MNKQVIGVCNFAEKNIAGVVSQVLILGAIDSDGKVVLLHPSQKTENGLPIAWLLSNFATNDSFIKSLNYAKSKPI